MMVVRERKYCTVCHQLGDGYHFGAVACKYVISECRKRTKHPFSELALHFSVVQLV